MKKTINVEGYNINYKITGQGEDTVVILQGWGTEMSLYDSIANSINSKYQVIQLDLPGFGTSDEPKEPWGVSDFCSIFVKLMEQLNVKKVSLIGHSYGGRIIIKLASGKWLLEQGIDCKKLPFAIDKIMLVDSAGIMPKKTFHHRFRIIKYKVLKKLLYVKPIYWLFDEIIDEWRKNQGSSDYQSASEVMKSCLVKAVNEDLTDLLKDIKQETLLVWGELDDATPISDGKLMEQLIPNAGLVEIKGAGHYSFLENKTLFYKVVAVFF